MPAAVRKQPYATALRIALLSLVLAAAPVAADPLRGRTLYENHCEGCHSARVHERGQRLPENIRQLREQVERWQQTQSLRWNDEDVGDVVEYLNAAKYRF